MIISVETMCDNWNDISILKSKYFTLIKNIVFYFNLFWHLFRWIYFYDKMDKILNEKGVFFGKVLMAPFTALG